MNNFWSFYFSTTYSRNLAQLLLIQKQKKKSTLLIPTTWEYLFFLQYVRDFSENFFLIWRLPKQCNIIALSVHPLTRGSCVKYPSSKDKLQSGAEHWNRYGVWLPYYSHSIILFNYNTTSSGLQSRQIGWQYGTKTYFVIYPNWLYDINELITFILKLIFIKC